MTGDACIGFWPLSAPEALRFRLTRMLSLVEVRRILADSGTEILVTDRAVFERNIGDRQALNVRTWIQADDEEETLEDFQRVSEDMRSFRRQQLIRPRRSPSFIPPAPADFPRARPYRAMHCWGRGRPRYSRDISGIAGPGAHRVALVAHHGREHCSLWSDGRRSRMLSGSL